MRMSDPLKERPAERTFACWYPARRREPRGRLSLGVAGVMDLDPLREETLATALATTAQNGATAFGLHAGTEAELAFARALRGLVGALHVVKVLKESGRREWRFLGGVSMEELPKSDFWRNEAIATDSVVAWAG